MHVDHELPDIVSVSHGDVSRMACESMLVLGLNFGHDAGATVLRDGIVLAAQLRERSSRKKHASALDINTIDLCLASAGVSLSQIDYVGIVTTQDYPHVFLERGQFQITTDLHPAHMQSGIVHPTSIASGLVVFETPNVATPPDAYVLPCLNFFDCHPSWLEEGSLDTLAKRDYTALLAQSAAGYLAAPVTVTIRDRTLPGYLVQHHLCHAAAGFFSADMEEAAILTHDGGGTRAHSYLGGMFYYGRGHQIFPITPHHLIAGSVYEATAQWLGLGDVGGSGKMMGLAAYGLPDFYNEVLLGNWYDIQRKTGVHGYMAGALATTAWKRICLEQIRHRGLDSTVIGTASRVTEAPASTIAASTQCLFEETLLGTLAIFEQILGRAGHQTANLVLSGGTALNVIANQRVVNETSFTNAFVNPGCDDSGLAMGAALAVYHCILDRPRTDLRANLSPYLGRCFTVAEVDRAIASTGDAVLAEAPEDWAAAAAADVAAGKIICWFEGRSEMGPRALGHRSTVADPRDPGMWAKMNRVKGREAWRPLAPSVLADRADEVFGDLPIRSPYMCFNARVTTDRLPAVTHVDGTARIQTVDSSAGHYERLIRAFDRLTGVPVVMNTSLNGPGEPIVDTPEDALRLLLSREVDSLFIEGRKVTRRRG